MNALSLLGVNARYVLAIGVLVAMFLPGLSGLLRPSFPVLVIGVLTMAMLRLDLKQMAVAAIKPRRFGLLVVITLVLMPVTALLLHWLALLLGLSEPWHDTLIYLAAAPPIASAAGVCILLGFNAALALEVAVFATLATPLIGVAVVNAFLSTPPDISTLEMVLGLGGIIMGAVVVSLVLRRIISPARIQHNASVLDGITVIIMLAFVIPVFDGIGTLAWENPTRALTVFAAAVLLNLGGNIVINLASQRFWPKKDAGAMGVLNGNRAIAIYLAIIPAEPIFALFVAFYQIPMYFTPLLARVIPVNKK